MNHVHPFSTSIIYTKKSNVTRGRKYGWTWFHYVPGIPRANPAEKMWKIPAEEHRSIDAAEFFFAEPGRGLSGHPLLSSNLLAAWPQTTRNTWSCGPQLNWATKKLDSKQKSLDWWNITTKMKWKIGSIGIKKDHGSDSGDGHPSGNIPIIQLGPESVPGNLHWECIGKITNLYTFKLIYLSNLYTYQTYILIKLIYFQKQKCKKHKLNIP